MLPTLASPLLGKEEEKSQKPEGQCSQPDLQQEAALFTL